MGPLNFRQPRLALLLGVLVALSPFAHSARANDADAEQVVQQRSITAKLSERLFNGIKKLATKVAATLSKSDHCDLTINSMERDERNRMYIDLVGECDLKFPMMPGKLKSYMEALPGHHVQSDGPINIDYTVSSCEATAEKTYHVEFQVKLIIVLEEVLSKLVKFGANVIGTVTLIGVGENLVSMVDGIDGVTVGESLGQGIKDMTQVLGGLAGVEAYDAWRGFRSDRQNIGAGQSSAGSVMMHLAGAVVKGGLKVANSIVGMSIGAAIGTALFPGVGSTVGAIVGAAGLTLVGNIVYKKLTVDLPIRWRLGRIRRMTENMSTSDSAAFKSFLAAKIDTQELKLVKRFSLELRTDKFQFFDELVGNFKKMTPDERATFASLRKKIEQKLQFEVMNRHDKLFAWKLDQMRAAFGDAPLAPSASPGN